jgi:hypothetical protein
MLAEQVRLIAANMIQSSMAVAVGVILIFFIGPISPDEFVNKRLLLGWGIYLAFVVAIRYALGIIYDRIRPTV